MAKAMRFKDKCAVITGAGDGIGLAYAHALAAEGAAIVVAACLASPGGAFAQSVAPPVVQTKAERPIATRAIAARRDSMQFPPKLSSQRPNRLCTVCYC